MIYLEPVITKYHGDKCLLGRAYKIDQSRDLSCPSSGAYVTTILDLVKAAIPVRRKVLSGQTKIITYESPLEF